MFIFSNLAISLDGKIAAKDRSFYPLGTPYDRRHMATLRRRSDAILMGASTFRVFKKPCIIPGETKQPVNIIVSRNLKDIDPEWPFFKSKKIERILFLSEALNKKKRADFEKSSELIFLDSNQSIASAMIEHLKVRGIQNLLLEGGGGTLWDFVKENRIDEYHVTLTPKIVGGATAPTLVDGEGFLPSQILSLRLKKCQKVGDELYLTYSKSKKLKTKR